MTTAAQATAAPVELRLGGHSFRMSPLTDRDIAELDNWLRTRVIRTARESLSPDTSPNDRQLVIDSAVRVAMSMTWMSGDGARQMATLDGMAQLLWQGIQHNHPETTPEQIRGLLLDPVTIEEARDTLRRLNFAGNGEQKKTGDEARREDRRRKKRERQRKKDNRRK